MDADVIGGFPMAHPNCRGCHRPLLLENAWMADGCPCNTPLGTNNFNETRWRLLMQLQQQQARAPEQIRTLPNPYEGEQARIYSEALHDAASAVAARLKIEGV